VKSENIKHHEIYKLSGIDCGNQHLWIGILVDFQCFFSAGGDLDIQGG
jgi:hypothetical protein